ncbi:cytochrome P450 78A3-like [Juglans microcarpa x Juglans regia]|uniref:cytochrome P450 78A3-like n=1 Tax=Juglans microcarpa x Juglans regia TaxID=2249226 RepID=UPI001B7EBF8E|nr:cytochrome P450 78A3-like [Juglans microcarpa x Juglans regia]
MDKEVESLWLFAFISECQALTETSIAWPILVMGVLAWLAMTLVFWAHPGGHAWGRHSWRNGESSALAKKKIPGPRGLPLVGSMQLMASLAHHRIAAAAKACGAKRLMAFSLGETRVIVTCNPDVAKEILHSSVFSDRPVKESAYSLMFNRAIGFAPYGAYWRTLRRIANTHLFSPKQIKASEAQRCEIAAQMVAMFGDQHGKSFRAREIFKRASLNNMMCSVFGSKYRLDSSNSEVEELQRMVGEGYELLGLLNWSDHLPWLSDFDAQKIRFRCSKLVPKVNRFVGGIIAQHLDDQNGENKYRDFIDVLLSLRGPEKLSDTDMIAVLWEMIFRGTDTVAVLMEWILARMVLHPDVQSKVQEELDNVVGRSRDVAEADVAALVYLMAVVKEVLRLHPPGPLLSWARLAINDTMIDGYHVPKGTMAMVNMWAIARDPYVWEDPFEFMPERFVSNKVEGLVDFSVLGSDLRLAPFGSGKRSCPGKTLGLTTVSFWVASLLHDYEWLPSDQTTGVDLSEVLRLSCEMANPLTAKLRPRRRTHLYH